MDCQSNDKTTNSQINKRPKIAFTTKEDRLIIYFVNLFGTKKWSFIAKFISGRTGKQCRDRYMNYLKPGLTNIEWTQEEDRILLELYSKYGPKWSLINKNFQNRNQVSLKNRFLFLQRQIGTKEAKRKKDLDQPFDNEFKIEKKSIDNEISISKDKVNNIQKNQIKSNDVNFFTNFIESENEEFFSNSENFYDELSSFFDNVN